MNCRYLFLLIVLLTAPAFAQLSGGPAPEVEVKPYEGPPVYLPEAPAPPPATIVGTRQMKVSKYDKSEQAHVERGMLQYSDNSFVNDGPYREFYPDGQLFVEGEYAKGQQVGEWTYNHSNGKLAKKITFVNGAPDGVIEILTPEGKPKARRVFKQGARDGEWIVYNAEGDKPLREENFKSGKRDGAYKTYFDDGSKWQETTFVADKPDGMAREWDRSGKLRAEIPFKAGLRDGVATVWTADGKKIEQTYAAGKLVGTATAK